MDINTMPVSFANTVFNKKQYGMSLLSLLFWLATFGGLFLLASKCVPPVFEYYEVKKSLAIAAKTGGSADDIRKTFDRNVEAGYIDSVNSKDLVMEGERSITGVRIDYNKTVHIAGPVHVLFKFSIKELINKKLIN